MPRPSILLMGVSGSGKSTVGRLLAGRLAMEFVDGDDLHPPANVAKMAKGLPLDDEDRAPWLLKVRAALLRGNAVVACSALKSAYRETLIRGGERTQLVYLKGGFELITSRLATRSDHFMPASLLRSQFAALEEPANAITVDVAPSPEHVADDILWRLSQAGD